MSHEVFISYASDDKPISDACCAKLEANGIRCWVAPRDIVSGLDWPDQIIDAIGKVKLMVLIYTAHSNGSQQVKREVERSVNRGIPIIPLRVEDVPLSKHMEYFISTPHWLDAMTPPLESHLDHLAETVKRVLEQMDSEPSNERPISKAVTPPRATPLQKAQPEAEPAGGGWDEIELGILRRMAPFLFISPSVLGTSVQERKIPAGLVAILIGLWGLGSHLTGIFRIISPTPTDAWFFENFVLFRPVNLVGALIGIAGSFLLILAGKRLLFRNGGGKEIAASLCIILGVWVGIWLLVLGANVLGSGITLTADNGILSGMLKLCVISWLQLGILFYLVRR